MNRISAFVVIYWLCNSTFGFAANIQIVYLSPSDKPYRPEYENAIVQAVGELQNWFESKLDGYTFSTPTDVVSWHQLPNTTSWYQTNPSSRPPEIRFWDSVLADAFAATGGHFNDPDNRWIYYIDADILPGQLVGGTSGVALLPANDLRGLNGDSLVPINPGDSTVNKGFDRWVGGLGHELGHALGLPHPPDSPGGPDDWALMYYGYLNFPNTYLRPSEEQLLKASPFFKKTSADFDNDGDVDGSDFLLWQTGFGTIYDVDDFTNWKNQYGTTSGNGAINQEEAVPEPNAMLLLLSAFGSLLLLIALKSKPSICNT